MTKTSHGDRDAGVRAVLTKRGDSGKTPRDTIFYFYGGDIKGLTAAATRVGYQTHPTVGKEGVILQTETAVDEVSFEEHSTQMQSWAIEFDSEYDGWECQLMVQ